ncbi:hypothetical protein FZEAL_618 [Fusarium zealandicum]|uniref:Uncharacterized protein n=1 Tax=Fusarium zealandicum TaxID=1053134 RepID=A0A8H4UUE8_9HYPO|nr:hypothetical protein FZEAL_618 [Fusarium zealandicum]
MALPEFRNIHGSFGLPTVTCFVPSLPPGTPFQISVHSWNTPNISQFTKSYTKHLSDVKYETRLFVDGRLVASTPLSRASSWPHVIANTFDPSKDGDLEPLKFPFFQQELLQQNHWSPADDLGRIKLVISEGFPRDSRSMPMERVHNVVAFSFQHAPQDILEGSGIAWPNPSMWHRAPYTRSMPVPSFSSNDAQSHAHSPRRHASGQLGVLPDLYDLSVPTVQGIMSDISTSHAAEEPAQASCTMPLPNTDEIPDCKDLINSFDDSNVCFDWTGKAGLTLNDIPQQSLATASNPSYDRNTCDNVDVSGHSYLTRDGSGHVLEDGRFANLAFSVDDEASAGNLKAPSNTPTTTEPNYCDLAVPFPFFPENTVYPEDFALSLTASLLNQPVPFQLQAPPTRTSTPEVRSRKENRKRHTTCPIPSSLSTGTTVGLGHQDQRKVSQQMYIPSGGGVPVPLVPRQTQSPQKLTHPELDQSTPYMGKFARSFSNISAQSSPRELANLDVNTVADKGTKRARHFTPGSAKTLEDDEVGHRRASPRIRLSPFAQDSPPSGQ